jgi:hypothetical protein
MPFWRLEGQCFIPSRFCFIRLWGGVQGVRPRKWYGGCCLVVLVRRDVNASLDIIESPQLYWLLMVNFMVSLLFPQLGLLCATYQHFP